MNKARWRELAGLSPRYGGNLNEEVAEKDLESRFMAVAASKPRHCEFWKAADGKWYLDLAVEEFGTSADAVTYGAFADEATARSYLDEHFASPGTASTDASGKRPTPAKSPNGEPIRVPQGLRESWANKKEAADEEIIAAAQKLLPLAEAAETAAKALGKAATSLDSLDSLEFKTGTFRGMGSSPLPIAAHELASAAFGIADRLRTAIKMHEGFLKNAKKKG